MAKTYRIDNIKFENLGGGSIFNTGRPEDFHELLNETEQDMLLVPLKEEVFFPYLNITAILDLPGSIATAVKAYKSKEPVFFFVASDHMLEAPGETCEADCLHARGAIGYIDEIEKADCLHARGAIGYIDEIEKADNALKVRLRLGPKGVILGLRRKSPHLRGIVQYLLSDRMRDTAENHKKFGSLVEIYKELAMHLAEDDRKTLIETFDAFPKYSARSLNFIMQNSPLGFEERYLLLEENSYGSQLDSLLTLFTEKKEELETRATLHMKTMGELGRRQREDFLRTQLNQIKEELGDTDDAEEDELRARADKKEWSDEVKKRFSKEMGKLLRLNPTSADYAVQFAYLDTFLDLPWDHCDNSEFNLDDVRRVLDEDHYGLDKVKERIVEQMAVLKLRRDTKAPILCLYGPPGVGKTSLGRSVARALGRKYVRVALGGLHDEAEIRGHRRTYLGSMPGRIINALEKCGTSDPVMVLDEIDKIGADYKGDPSQALLEVLDPEQNCRFHDNYIDQDYDLSKVLFIATANTLSTISAPLLDRMEMIEISGYMEAEKLQIAKRHLIPKNREEHGFEADEMEFSDDALMLIINDYTRESGVRRLEKRISEIMRKQACLKASGKPFPRIIDAEIAADYLGKPDNFNDVYENNDTPGVVTGLAWTAAGGEILFIESSTSPGKEGKLVLTGNLGDVMKESAMLALQYIKANHARLGIDEKDLEVGTVHVHVPEGAVPKDGPSAGITILTSLASTFTGRKVRDRLAMTGEITLRGKVLPVGGIKEKILAAKRAGIKTIMLCEKNRKDIEEIKPEYIEGLDFHYVDNVDQALDFALV